MPIPTRCFLLQPERAIITICGIHDSSGYMTIRIRAMLASPLASKATRSSKRRTGFDEPECSGRYRRHKSSLFCVPRKISARRKGQAEFPDRCLDDAPTGPYSVARERFSRGKRRSKSLLRCRRDRKFGLVPLGSDHNDGMRVKRQNYAAATEFQFWASQKRRERLIVTVTPTPPRTDVPGSPGERGRMLER
jgi:hypothetical protein